MLPDDTGQTREFIRSDVKVRQDSPALLPGDAASGVTARIVHRIVWRYGITCPPLDRALIGTYGVGGHFAWHRDDMLPATANRETAIVVGLSDDYDGGLLELPEAGLSIKVRRGMGVAFPASALHRVTPVTRGVREVLLTFVLKAAP